MPTVQEHRSRKERNCCTIVYVCAAASAGRLSIITVTKRFIVYEPTRQNWRDRALCRVGNR
uniref:Uncharacterized protein n=1 Tax=Anopheles dirus TaxID=7168 RepID=A0A182NXD8_9DIPT